MTMDQLAQKLAEKINDDPNLNRARHVFACEKLGLDADRQFRDEDENAPWYPLYWDYVRAHDVQILMRIMVILGQDK